MAVSENLSDFEDDDNENVCENGTEGCVNAPGVSEMIDGDIEKIQCFECFSEGRHAE